jgi:hypothetical protein
MKKVTEKSVCQLGISHYEEDARKGISFCTFSMCLVLRTDSDHYFVHCIEFLIICSGLSVMIALYF